jgi:hypothetical protein
MRERKLVRAKNKPAKQFSRFKEQILCHALLAAAPFALTHPWICVFPALETLVETVTSPAL